MKNDTDDNPQKTEDNIKIEKKEDIDDADDSNDTDYKEETEDSEETEHSEETEETEDSEETEETEETEDLEETEETKNTEESDCTQEYVINKDINYELNNEEYNNNFNKFQDDDNNQMIYLILNTNKKNDTNNKCVKSKSNNGLNLNKHPINKKIYKFYNKYSINEKKYFDILSEEEKTKLIECEDVIENADLIVIGISSQGFKWACDQLTKIKKNQQILILTKGLGINKNKYEVYPDVIKNFLLKKKIKNIKISVAAGPCLAAELSKRVFTNVVFANRDISVVKNLSKMISTSYYKIKCSSDLIGVAACGGVKNIYSMIVGTSMGMNLKTKL